MAEPRTDVQRARRIANGLIWQHLRGPDAPKPQMVRTALALIAKSVLHGKPRSGQCCQWEDREMNGGCQNCGDPCL